MDCNGHSGGGGFPFFTLLWHEWDGAEKKIKTLYIASCANPLGWPVTLKTYKTSRKEEANESWSSSLEQAHPEVVAIP